MHFNATRSVLSLSSFPSEQLFRHKTSTLSETFLSWLTSFPDCSSPPQWVATPRADHAHALLVSLKTLLMQRDNRTATRIAYGSSFSSYPLCKRNRLSIAITTFTLEQQIVAFNTTIATLVVYFTVLSTTFVTHNACPPGE
jgi:hypothetical protein